VIDILALNGTKDLLMRMTPSERGLFLLFGYASNQVNVLWKLVTIATNETPENPIEQRVSGAQTQILVRLVLGVPWEAWRLVQGRFLGSELGREFVPKLDAQALAALDRLKKAFGGSNMIVAVRNDFSFHYTKTNDMEAAFQAAVAGDAMEEADWGVYFTTMLLNTFFFVSDYVFSHGIANAVQGASVAEAHEQLLMSLAPIANDFSEVAYDFARALFVKYLGPEVGMTVVAQIKDAPNIDKLSYGYLSTRRFHRIFSVLTVRRGDSLVERRSRLPVHIEGSRRPAIMAMRFTIEVVASVQAAACRNEAVLRCCKCAARS
jgi:hypothetical protein